MDCLTHLTTFMNAEEANKLYDSLNDNQIHCLRVNDLPAVLLDILDSS